MVDTLMVPPSRFRSPGSLRNRPSMTRYFLKKPTSAVASTEGVLYKTGSFTKSVDAAPVDQSVTGIGFTPKALILFTHGSASADDAIGTQSAISMGFSDGTTSKSIWSGSKDAVATSDANRYASSSEILITRSVTGGAAANAADLKSLDADGFTLTWTTNSASATIIKYIAIAGDDIEGVDVGSFTTPVSTTGVQNVSTSLNTADFVMLLSNINITEDTTNANSWNVIGVASGTSNQGVCSIFSDDNQATSNTSRYQRTNNIYAYQTSGALINDEASFNGFTASGFDLNWSTSDSSARTVYYLTIKGGSWEVGNGTTPTTISTKAFTTSFEPKGIGMFSHNDISNPGVRANALLSIGASDGTNNTNISLRDTDNLTTTDSARASSSTKSLRIITTSAIDLEADLDSFNATDFTLNFTNVAGTAREFIWFAAGDTPAVPPEPGALFATGSFAKSTSAGPVSQAVTGIGFTPKAILLFSSQTSGAEDTIAVHYEQAIGFSDGTTEKSIWTGSEDGVVSGTDADRYSNSGKLLTLRDISSGTSGALLAECDLTSFDSDGFTINWTTNNAVASHIKYVAIGGDDITDVDVGSFISSASPGTQNVATNIDTADFIMILGQTVASGSEDTLLADSIMQLGVAASSSQRGVICNTSEDNTTPSFAKRNQQTDKIISTHNVAGTLFERFADFTGFTSTGFDLNWTNAGASVFYYLTIKGGQWQVGNDVSKTSTGTQAYTTSFQPKGLIQFNDTASPSTSVDNNAFFNLGAADGTNVVSISDYEQTGAGTSNTAKLSSSTKCYQAFAASTSTLIEADLDSFNATDFTLNFTKATGVARFFIWLILGDNP